MSMINFKKIIPLIGIIVLIYFDQISKLYVSIRLHHGEHERICKFLNIVLLHNYGVGFGLLQEWSMQIPIILSSILILIIIFSLYKFNRTSHINHKLGLYLVLSGGLSNLLERIIKGYVTDFLSFHLGNSYLPAFNLADIFITIGIVLLITSKIPLCQFYEEKKS